MNRRYSGRRVTKRANRDGSDGGLQRKPWDWEESASLPVELDCEHEHAG